MAEETTRYARHYSEGSFWGKITTIIGTAGRELVEKALWLYYAARKPDTPQWARMAIYGALGYLILPLDLLPDWIPVVGYGDDLGVLLAALGTVAMYIDDEVKASAARKMAGWFD